MWKDPIVTETRSLRNQYADQFGLDADAIFQDILRRQAGPNKRLVTFEHRKPVLSEIITDQERLVMGDCMNR